MRISGRARRLEWVRNEVFRLVVGGGVAGVVHDRGLGRTPVALQIHSEDVEAGISQISHPAVISVLEIEGGYRSGRTPMNKKDHGPQLCAAALPREEADPRIFVGTFGGDVRDEVINHVSM